VENIEQPSVRAFLKQQGTWDQKFSKAQQDHLECVNKQEVAEKVIWLLPGFCDCFLIVGVDRCQTKL
jgi:hypothetical protein